MSDRADILCLSSIDFDFIWQGHQEIMSTLAAQGHRVLFVENTGVRPPRFSDLPRIRQRLRNWWRGTKGFRQQRENLFIYSPVLLPFPYSWLARRINRFVLLRSLRQWMKATGFRRPIAWTFLPTPLARDLIHRLDPQLLVYYCIDDLASSSVSARRISQSEERIFAEADLVFVTSEKLRERAARHSQHVHRFPFGVNFRAFEQVRTSPDQIPSDLARFPRPVIGYVGGLHQWVDQDLLAQVAGRLPDCTFVLVGPPQTDVSRLTGCANVHVLGQRPHADVPRYVKGFDVGLVPYTLSPYTTNVYPTKLNEYLAMGIPVVATDLPEIRRFNADHGGIVGVAGTPELFASAIQGALGQTSEAAREQRIAVARTNGWDERIARMSELIDRAVAAKRTKDERWDATLRRIYRRSRRRLAVAAVVVAMVLWVALRTSVVWQIAAPLAIYQEPQPADAIVVFAGGVGESGKAGGGYQDRMKSAIDLYNDERAPRMILSSGFVFAFREAEVMQELALDRGVPESAIVLETRAGNTYQNVVFVRDILRRNGWRRVLLVSSPYHMRRALLTWRKNAPEVEVICVPARSQFYAHDGPRASLEQVRAIAQEYVAIAAYWWKGWI